MRRMYSEKELTTIIKQVSEAYIDELIEDGVFNTKINEYVDAYLDENPITPSDLDFSSIDFIAKTLSQTNPNYSVNFPINTGMEGVTITNIYSKFIVVNNVAHIVFNFKVLNDTGSPIDRSGSLFYGSISSIPSAIASKIYDWAGKTVAESANQNVITIVHMLNRNSITFSSGKSENFILVLQNNTTVNGMEYRMSLHDTASTYSLPTGTTYFTGRITMPLF